MQTATAIVKSLKRGDIELLVLPELAFTGYSVESREEILPFCEEADNGPSVEWAKTTAVRLAAFVQLGFAEKMVGSDGMHLYNSICFVSPDGTLITTYQKHFLFTTDESWASEGSAFKSMFVEGLGMVGFGICMDLNPYKFQSPFDAFEFGCFHRDAGSSLLLVSMAWLKQDDAAMDLSTIQYWANRIAPIVRDVSDDRQVHVVICNRIGTERGVTFCGNSCVLRICRNGVRILARLDRVQVGLLIAET